MSRPEPLATTHLSPCPFDGREAIVKSNSLGCWVECSYCGTQTANYAIEDNATWAWNKRAPVSETAAKTEHVDGRWCADLKCSRCYAADTWLKAAALQRPNGCRYPNCECGSGQCVAEPRPGPSAQSAVAGKTDVDGEALREAMKEFPSDMQSVGLLVSLKASIRCYLNQMCLDPVACETHNGCARSLQSSVRRTPDDGGLSLFHDYLDKTWPLWKGHIGSVHYMDQRKAFFAGLDIGRTESANESTDPDACRVCGLFKRAPDVQGDACPGHKEG